VAKVHRDGNRAFYCLTLTEEAYSSLGWIADRYSSAEVLYDRARTVRAGEGRTLIIAENVAWDYMAELEEENGGSIVPTCAGGSLAEELLSLWQLID
jgi:hypothetical protein